MFYEIYFDDRWGEKRYVGTVEKEQIWPTIDEYIHKLAPNYKTPYVRTWEEDLVIHYDVGSHTEFFYAVPIDLSIGAN